MLILTSYLELENDRWTVETSFVFNVNFYYQIIHLFIISVFIEHKMKQKADFQTLLTIRNSHQISRNLNLPSRTIFQYAMDISKSAREPHEVSTVTLNLTVSATTLIMAM